MNRRRLAAFKPLLVLCSLLAPAPAQTPAAPQTPPAQSPQPQATPDGEGDDVVRITANLVQFDAVVYDKDNRPVTDLRPEDFEVTVSGKRQEITN
ncbi:MAG TPA: hypothetical protein VG148_09505, partial [Pyrinomonadaceae bacterium]|nr:hypothetical protein [Pyrinomonadaceae bacterium]